MRFGRVLLGVARVPIFLGALALFAITVSVLGAAILIRECRARLLPALAASLYPRAAGKVRTRKQVPSGSALRRPE